MELPHVATSSVLDSLQFLISSCSFYSQSKWFGLSQILKFCTGWLFGAYFLLIIQECSA